MNFVKFVGDNVLGRYEEGLFTSEGIHYPFQIKENLELDINGLRQVQEMPDDWTNLYPLLLAENESFKAEAGETSYGGFGFVYLIDKSDSSVVWYLYCGHQFNNPMSVKLDQDTVIVITDANYPKYTKWSIPFEQPQLLKVGLI